jgi:putative zinc finger protein
MPDTRVCCEAMEGAHLRPVPARPPGPVDPGQAVRHVREILPALDESAATALALVALAGRPRTELAAEGPLGPAELGDALARARKALRRSLFPLPGSGWCERAERLISDRLDGTLEPPGPARLDVHLRNCERCVEHERRLAQATDSLVAAYVEQHPAVPSTEPEAPPEPEQEEEAAPELRVVEYDEAPAPPAPVPERPEPARPPVRSSLAALAWTGLFALAIVLAVATVALLVIGLTGHL